jgi:hypothetical protein
MIAVWRIPEAGRDPRAKYFRWAIGPPCFASISCA